MDRLTILRKPKDALRNMIKPRFPNAWVKLKSSWKFAEAKLGLRSFARYAYYEELDTIFISLAKNANTTINHMLQKKISVGDRSKSPHGYKHSVSISRRQFIQLDTSNIFVFAFTRNPLTRLVSAYENKINTNQPYQPLTQRYFGAFYQHMPFREFVEKVCKIPDWRADEHFISQSYEIYPEGTDKTDFIGRVEDFSEDITYIRNKFDLSEPPRSNKSTWSSGRDLSHYYNQELAEKVYRRYESDFKNFGYTESYQNLILNL